MNEDPVALLRASVCAVLPDALTSAIQSYWIFSASDWPEEAVAFGRRHNACKAALAHLEALVRLARWAGTDGTLAALEIDRMLAAAQTVLDDCDEEDRLAGDFRADDP